MIRGRATPEGTRRFAARSRSVRGHFRESLGLTLSSIGIGTYLGPDDDATDLLYREAVGGALTRAVNVIDTAINYRGERSERAVGAALKEAIDAGTVARDEVLVSTKGGYLLRSGGLPRPEEVVAGCHCLAPGFLDDQLEESRRNLGLETIDLYLLHNPEHQLEEVSRRVLLSRVETAFELLERAVAEGRIGSYGMATWNGYREEMGNPRHLSLDTIYQVARAAGGENHHFRAVQLPFNLAMPEAFTRKNQMVCCGVRQALLESAPTLGLYVMCSASILQGGLARDLPEEVRRALPRMTDAQRSLQLARSTPGVGTALVGMKRLAHVEENAALAAVEPAPEELLRGILDRQPSLTRGHTL